MKKEQIVKMLSNSDIMNYEKIRTDFMWWKLYPISSDDCILIMIKALSSYDKIIQEILKDLDW